MRSLQSQSGLTATGDQYRGMVEAVDNVIQQNRWIEEDGEADVKRKDTRGMISKIHKVS